MLSEVLRRSDNVTFQQTTKSNGASNGRSSPDSSAATFRLDAPAPALAHIDDTDTDEPQPAPQCESTHACYKVKG